MKTFLACASLIAAFALGFSGVELPSSAGNQSIDEKPRNTASKADIAPQKAPKAPLLAQTQAPSASSQTQPRQKAAKKRVQLPSPPVSQQFSYRLNDKQFFASVTRQPLNGYTVTETTLNAPLFMRVFEKDGHVLTAFNFRPDAIATLDASLLAPKSGAYTIAIGRGDTVYETVDIKEHHAGQEWVWMNKPINFVRRPMDTGQYPRHEIQKIYNASRALVNDDATLNKQSVTPALYVPLSTGRIVPKWGRAGKQPRVHWDTYTSAWILTGNDAFWARTVEAALGHLASPLARFAAGTSDIPDLTTQEYARTYLGVRQYRDAPRVPRAEPNDSMTGVKLTTDTPHWAAPQWEVYALSDHPYFLYSAQQFTNYVVWASRPRLRHKQNNRASWRDTPNYTDPNSDVPDRLVVDSQEQRSLGKGLMGALRLWTLTPEDAPDWLLPKSYWAKVIRDTQAYIADNYGNAALWKLGLTERNYYDLKKNKQADVDFDFMDLQINWAIYACLYAGFDEFQDIADHITLKTGEILAALGPIHPSFTKAARIGRKTNANFNTWHEVADYVRANPDTFIDGPAGKQIRIAEVIGPNFIGTRWKWNAPRVQAMTAIIWQLAKDNGDSKTQEAFAQYWRSYEKARVHFSYYNHYREPQPYWSLGHWKTAIDWMVEGPDPSGRAQVFAESEMVRRGMIAPR